MSEARTPAEAIGRTAVRVAAGAVLAFLIAPLLVIVPLSFNATPFFTFTPEMLAFKAEGWSWRWYAEILSSAQWRAAAVNSLGLALASTLLATVLGTLAALGLQRADLPGRAALMALLLSPLIVPIVIAAAGMYFFYSALGLANSWAGLVIAHTVLGVPFVVITVSATLAGFDRTLERAASSLGAPPHVAFFRVTLPIILPGVISGALFAFVTSFDEVVTVLFLGGPEQLTVPRQMWAGVREQLSPAILAVATLLTLVAIALLATVEALRRRSERLRSAA